MVSSQLLECRSTGLSVSPVSVGPCLVVVVAGEADWVTAPRLREQLAAALAYVPQSLVLDLTDLEFCNSPGLRALLEPVEAARQAGVHVEMRGMSRQLSSLHRAFVAHRRTDTQRGRLPVGMSSPRPSFGGAEACRPVESACESAP